ncbi:MAG: carbon starvation protein A [Spirochaetaceae bacterium]|nr:carbon starvation protein A [Spirochaetaceae bacterium]
MVTFLIGVAILIVGYFVYGALVERVFQPDDRPTPAVAHADGIDFVPMATWRIFLIQLLNIAGLGPIFGAISGALWGPSVYLWIVFGTILAGGVHDYISAMQSERNNGASISEIVGKYMGPVMKQVMRVFSVVLLVMVGTVFMVGPAGLIALLTPETLDVKFWTIVILIYYTLATFLPVDKLIGKLYPVFGIAFILMAVIIGGATIINHFNGSAPMLELWDHPNNMHPTQLPRWPMMFITVACGALSGFHATQSPLMARCIKSERQGRRIFYGAMAAEGVIALIWAAAASAFFYKGGVVHAEAFAGNSTTVYNMSTTLAGVVGGVIAMIGVIACPITSGDTAFRAARLTIADWFKIDQKGFKNRLILTIPILGIGFLISFVDYNIVWRYFSWSNQTLAMLVLWCAAVYLVRYRENKVASWIATIPATFMAAVSCSYLLQAPEGFKLDAGISNIVGVVFAAACLIFFLIKVYVPAKGMLQDVPLEVKK